jgi:hypothetical protein
MSYETPQFPESADPNDPLRLFQSLPTLELSAQELSDMKRSVHEMRRAKAIEAESTTAPPPRRAATGSAGILPAAFRRFTAGSTGRFTAWNAGILPAALSRPLRLAAAFVLLIGASLLLPTLGSQPMQVAHLTAGVPTYSGPSRAEREAAEALPLVENVTDEADLIQIEDSEMSLVVIAAIR